MSSFAVSNLKGVKVYNLTFGKTAEQWKEEQRAGNIRSLRYNEAFRRRVEFVQEAVYPVACLQCKMSEDGEWLLTTGVYPPKLKLYDLSQLTMKFERGLETEPIDISFLSSNWEKFVILRSNRWMEFHSRHGKHYNMRMPLAGTSIAYNAPMCELYTATIKNLVFRTNLEQGRYFAPFETSIDHINTCDIDSTHLLCSFGGNNGICECWDPRNKECVSKLDIYDSIPSISPTPGIEKVKFGSDGLTLAIGLSSGHTAVYDIRRYKPLYVLNQKNHQSILDINFHSQSNTIITADSKSIRYWKLSDGELYTIIQPSERINSICSVENSGVIFVGQEQHRIGSYYIPSIGCAPKWCPFLDSMTDELEENKYQSIYYNYKFITKNELEGLGLIHLIGTNLLKPYMHGYYIDSKLYTRVKAIVDPDAYEKFLKMKTKEKIDETRNNRIGIVSALDKNSNNNNNNNSEAVSNELKNVKINKGYANYLIDKSQNLINTTNDYYDENDNNNNNSNNNDNEDTKEESRKKIEKNESKIALEALIDPRFNIMFKNSEFEVSNDRLMKDLQFRPELLRNDDILNAMQYDTIKEYAISHGFGKKSATNVAMDDDNDDEDRKTEENRIITAQIIDKMLSGDDDNSNKNNNNDDSANGKQKFDSSERFVDSDDDENENEFNNSNSNNNEDDQEEEEEEDDDLFVDDANNDNNENDEDIDNFDDYEQDDDDDGDNDEYDDDDDDNEDGNEDDDENDESQTGNFRSL